MVQLKEQPLQLHQSDWQISIPYGSIKSRRERTNATYLPWFQFLMVQLKEKNYPIPTSVYEISIPYGSIKRPEAERIFMFLKNFNSLWFN